MGFCMADSMKWALISEVPCKQSRALLFGDVYLVP